MLDAASKIANRKDGVSRKEQDRREDPGAGWVRRSGKLVSGLQG